MDIYEDIKTYSLDVCNEMLKAFDYDERAILLQYEKKSKVLDSLAKMYNMSTPDFVQNKRNGFNDMRKAIYKRIEELK